MSIVRIGQTSNDLQVIGVDIGKTKIAVGAVSHTGVVTHHLQQPTDLAGGASGVTYQCRQMIQEMINLSSLPLKAIGIGVSGIIDHQDGVIIRTRGIPNCKDIPLRAILEREFQLPVVVVNDVYAAAFGELRFGAARAISTAVYLSISTGIGLTVINEGKLWHGSHGLAGHIAHLPLLGRDETVNDLIGGSGIAEAAKRITGIELTTTDVFRMAEEDKEPLRSIVNNAIHDTAMILAWIQQIVDPDLFIVGGGIAVGQKSFVDQVREQMQNLLSYYMEPTEIRLIPAFLGDKGGIIGAAMLGQDSVRLTAQRLTLD